MSKKSDSIKSNFLGMPHGTACNRLRKLIMFELVKRLDLNVCFVCGLAINDVLEFSIEHKNPWLHVDQKLFWDLDNIVFSHIACNRPNNPSGPQRPKINDTTTWCPKCKDFVENIKFGRNRSAKNGMQGYCNPCRKNMGWEK